MIFAWEREFQCTGFSKVERPLFAHKKNASEGHSDALRGTYPWIPPERETQHLKEFSQKEIEFIELSNKNISLLTNSLY